MKRLFDSLDIFQVIAKELDVEVAAIKAVAHVESRGDGFLPSGHPKILFEGHHFSRLTKGIYDSTNPTISYPKWTKTYYCKNSEKEVTERLCKAAALNEEAAYKSASWGKFQIMGFNHLIAGFKTITDFVEAMKKDEDEHFRAFGNFIKSNNAMHRALKEKDWTTFAKHYNGPKYWENKYDKKMESAYEKFSIK